MPDQSSNFAKATASIRRINQLGAPDTGAGAALPPALGRLRAWQMARLTRTYADFLESDRYGPACRFFLSDLYAPRDFTDRDQGFKQLHDALGPFLPGSLLALLRGAIALNEATKALDLALLATLEETTGLTKPITDETYAAAYRQCDNYDARRDQIDQIVALGKGVDQMVRLPFVGLALRLARAPAQRAGWGAAQDFLERGFAAFKQMGGADTFLETIARREKEILDAIYAGR